MKAAYKRILLKLSGEYLGGDRGEGFDFDVIKQLTNQISEIRNLDVEIAIVLGGGNFFRGTRSVPLKMDRVAADHIGMMATLMNAICLNQALLDAGKKSRVMTGLSVPDVAEPFNSVRANTCLKEGEILIFGGGTGNPFFSTDTAAVLRGLEIKVDIIVKGTKVDGVYDKDPVTNPTAKKFEKLAYGEVLQRDLKVMDGAAIALCRENHVPICVLSAVNRKDIVDFVKGESIGTMISE